MYNKFYIVYINVIYTYILSIAIFQYYERQGNADKIELKTESKSHSFFSNYYFFENLRKTKISE